MEKDSHLPLPLMDLVNFSAIQKGERMLFVGTPHWAFLHKLKTLAGEEGEMFVAIPASSNGADREGGEARKGWDHKTFHLSPDLSGIPFPDLSFDKILVRIPPYSPFLNGNDSIFREFHRVLKKEGIILLLTRSKETSPFLNFFYSPIHLLTGRGPRRIVSLFGTLEKAGFWDISTLKERGGFTLIEGRKLV